MGKQRNYTTPKRDPDQTTLKLFGIAGCALTTAAAAFVAYKCAPAASAYIFDRPYANPLHFKETVCFALAGLSTVLFGSTTVASFGNLFKKKSNTHDTRKGSSLPIGVRPLGYGNKLGSKGNTYAR